MGRSLLVVDDDPRIRASVGQALGAEDLDVRAADSAEQALAMVGERCPDVVLADVRMPGMDGLSLLRLLRERAPDVGVVMMTAFDDLPTVTAAMRDGAVDFLVKPLDLHLLRRILIGLFDDRQPAAEWAIRRARHHLSSSVVAAPARAGAPAAAAPMLRREASGTAWQADPPLVAPA